MVPQPKRKETIETCRYNESSKTLVRGNRVSVKRFLSSNSLQSYEQQAQWQNLDLVLEVDYAKFRSP